MKQVIRYVYRLFAVVLALCLLCAASGSSVSAGGDMLDYTRMSGYTAPEINSPCAFVMEMNTGTILYAKNADEPHAPASTIKSLTALVAVETADLSEIVTFSESAVYDIEEGGNNYDMRVGETMSLRSCLKIMMMASCNEAAYCIAEHIGGSLSGFAELMNARARKLGAVSSNFNNPHGLTDLEQYTTAHDLALIFAECVKNPLFMEVSAIESCCVTDTSLSSYGYVYANHDKMMQPDSVYYRDYVRCGKTGFITQAGNTLVTYASQDGMDIVCAILSGESYDAVYNDTISLCDYAFENYTAVNTSDLLDGQIEAGIGESTVTCDEGRVLLPGWLTLDDVSAEIHEMKKTEGALFSGLASVSVGDDVHMTEFEAEPVVPMVLKPPAPLPIPELEPEPAEQQINETPEEEGERWAYAVLAVSAVVILGCTAAIVILGILLAKTRKKLRAKMEILEK